MPPDLSIIIPAHNEESWLPATLRAAFSAARGVGRRFEVIVVDDASTDRTADVARAAGALVVPVACRQIAAARNAGARAARGRVFFFVDADTLATAAAVAAGLRAIERCGAIGGGCLTVFDGRTPVWARVLLPIGSAVARVLNATGGAFLFCRRSDFDAVGGFDQRYFAAEEVAFVRALKRRGRFVIPRDRVVTSGRKVRTLSLARVARTLWQFVRRGHDAYLSRDGLDLWYGPDARRDAP